MTESDKLTRFKRSIGNETENANLLIDLLDYAKEIILNKMYPFGVPDNAEVPSKYNIKQIDIAVHLYSKRGAEGETSHSENGINRTYESASVPTSLLRDIFAPSGYSLMRCLNKNKQKMYYALYISNAVIKDTNGFETGEKADTYGTKTELYANISPAVGYVSAEQFGLYKDYSKVIVVEGTSCPITETTILWIDNLTATTNDYVVKRVSKSLNSTSIAIDKVGTS